MFFGPTDVFPRIGRKNFEKIQVSNAISSKQWKMNHEILIGSLWDPYSGLIIITKTSKNWVVSSNPYYSK